MCVVCVFRTTMTMSSVVLVQTGFLVHVASRWLHEDCAEERLVDEEGKELFCPYCVI